MSKPAASNSKTAKKRIQWPRVRELPRKGRTKPWMVDARLNGKGERFFFETATEADTKAEQLRMERRNTGQEGVAVPMKLRADAVEAERRLAAVGASIMDAVSFYLAHAKPAGGARTIQQLIVEFIAAKRNAGRKESYLGVQNYVLGNVVAEEFGKRTVHEVTAPEIEAWMNRKKWSMRTRLNYFSDIRNLFGFAVRKGYRPTNPMDRLEKPAVTERSPGVLTIEQT